MGALIAKEVAVESSLLSRQALLRIKDRMSTLPQLEQKLSHHFINGVCVRSLAIPAGAGAVGKVHKTEYIAILAKGSALLANEDGEQQIEAGFIQECKPGTMNVFYAITDCVFMNVLRTDKTDINDIVSEAVCDTHEEFLEGLCHLQQS